MLLGQEQSRSYREQQIRIEQASNNSRLVDQ